MVAAQEMVGSMVTRKKGIGAGGDKSAPVTFEGAGVRAISGGSTSLAVAAPALAAVGDLLIAVLMVRSAPSAPAGWVLEAQETGTQASQRTVVYSKVATVGDLANTTFTQAASNRFVGNMMAFAKGGAAPNVLATAKRVDTNAYVATLASVTGTKDGQMAVASGSTVYADASNSLTLSGEWTQTTPVTASDNRLGAGYRTVENGDVTGGTITAAGVGISTNSWPLVTVLLG